MNKFIGVGRISTEVEVKYTQSGKCVAEFNLAINRPKKQGQERAEADFLKIIVWGKQAEACGNYVGKGSQVLVEGRVQVRSYETNEGQKRWVTEIVAEKVEFLESRKSGNHSGSGAEQFGQSVSEEEIPF